ncbi:hypothetical protein ACFXTN_010622 [Malus domestica]
MLPQREDGVAPPAVWSATRATLHDDANVECPGTCMWAQQSHMAPPAPQLPQPASNDDYFMDVILGDLRPVYVDHSLFKELADRSDDDTINVACKVVLFEHLLGML